MTEAFYQLSADAAIERLQTDRANGLTGAEAARRLRQYGPNLLREKPKRSPLFLLADQFNDLLIILLIAAAGLAFYLRDFRGGTILLAIVCINALIGAYQEYKAEKTLELLKKLIKTKATVVRDGERHEVEEHELVPGDIVFLEEGGSVPADIRLIEDHEFRTNDFILTGESVPQQKRTEFVIDHEASLSDQDNIAFFGTTVASGNALGVVFATAGDTAIGGIAQISESIQRDTSPLQAEINALAKALTILAGVIALSLFATNILLRAEEFETTGLLISSSLMFAIGVAAACVPQGLPAQISVALSLGVGRLARKNAVVKRLSSVETLGSTNVICSDKTGTITRNEMTIVACWFDGLDLEVSGDGYEPVGEILQGGHALSGEALEALQPCLRSGLLASHGRTHAPDDEHGSWYAVGDPTEAAFMPLAIKAGFSADELDERFPVLEQLPFDSKRKRMTMVREVEGHAAGFMKGALEGVLDCCQSVRRRGKTAPLTEAERQAALDKAQEYSARSLRVIALAYREFPPGQKEFRPAELEREFVFAGLVGMLDPPRQGVERAVQSIRDAHIRLFMITGDDPVTAEAIAENIGMEDGRVLTDEDLRSLPDEKLKTQLEARSLIFSRVSPADKLRIVRLLKENGEVVAVTGDGVNDTLSLKQADIGVAMGGLGSEVAKDAAEIVLIDDNFSTLAAAILEGRTIFQNIRRVILSSITSNLGELGVVIFGFLGVAAGLPIPFTAVQILAIDLIAEMLPLMALTFDPPESRVMQRRPRPVGEHIINLRSLAELFFFGGLMSAAAYSSFLMVMQTGGTAEMARAAAYASIALIQYANILSRRSSQTVFVRRTFTNAYLWWSLAISLLGVVLTTGVPAIAVWFGFEPLRLEDWLWPVGGAAIFLLVFEASKLLFRRRAPSAKP